jgi:hypothetical protein
MTTLTLSTVDRYVPQAERVDYFRACSAAKGHRMTFDEAAATLSRLVRLVRFADDHDRPAESVIVYLAEGPAVRIFSTEHYTDGLVVTVSDDVRTIGEARAVLGY